ncbi:MAG: asparagine synthase (glutamine-hydrolyzing), partial [Leptospiraceae bacterium]|nr:asparagine synthase (glutamine-hydrolyzing) [Leptospiraceae bacterium]
MCGIAGIINQELAVSERELLVSTMMKKLMHRGPDDSGIYSGNGFTIGHQRLSIIDLENGKQPMVSVDGRYSIVFNGEIYNYLELRQRLVQKGIHFQTYSDTEVLLQLLILEKEKAFCSLNGMFAFAFIDNESGEWILARDHFGIKPLYYFVDETRILFASEIKALFAKNMIAPQEDWHGIEQYLTFQFCLGEGTLFRDIKKVEPGYYIKGKNSSIVEKKSYWDTIYQIDEFHTKAFFVEELRYLLDDSLKLQIRSDVPVGAYLSGGLDSSVVSSYASRHLDSSIPVFNGLFSEAAEYDESHFAKILAESIQADYFEVIPTEKDFVDSIRNLIYMMDEPVAGPGVFPQYMVSKFASEHVKVVLGGQG